MGSIHGGQQHFRGKNLTCLKKSNNKKTKQRATVQGGGSNCWISNQDKGINDFYHLILFRLAPLTQRLHSCNTAAFVPGPHHRGPYAGPHSSVTWLRSADPRPCEQLHHSSHSGRTEASHTFSGHNCWQVALHDWITATFIRRRMTHPS